MKNLIYTQQNCGSQPLSADLRGILGIIYAPELENKIINKNILSKSQNNLLILKTYNNLIQEINKEIKLSPNSF